MAYTVDMVDGKWTVIPLDKEAATKTFHYNLEREFCFLYVELESFKRIVDEAISWDILTDEELGKIYYEELNKVTEKLNDIMDFDSEWVKATNRWEDMYAGE